MIELVRYRSEQTGIILYQLLSRVIKRRSIIATMMGGTVILLLFMHLYLLDFSSALPLDLNKPYFHHEKKMNSWDTVKQERSWLDHLINSKANKEMFANVQFSNGAFYDIDHSIVGTGDYPQFNQYQRQPYVSNGYIGARIPKLGQGFTYDLLSMGGNEEELSNGWPLFNKRYSGAFLAGFFNLQQKAIGSNFPELSEKGYDSFISAIPQWTSLQVIANKEGKVFTLDPSLLSTSVGEITNYNQNLSLANGVVTTKFIWLDTFEIKYETIAHKSQINLGIVNLEIVNLDKTSEYEITILDVIDFNSAQRCQLSGLGHDSRGIYMTFQPSEVNYVDGAIYSSLQVDGGIIDKSSTNDTTIQHISYILKSSKSINVSKYVGIASTDLDPKSFKTRNDVLQYAKNVVNDNYNIQVQQLIKTHKEAWNDQSNALPSITFGGNSLLTMTARASIYHLAANTRPDAQGLTAAVGVGGLSSDSYAGMVFWDSDLWMMNGILPFMPSHARSFVNYRVHTHAQAIENVPGGFGGAAYPWTSGRFGNCTATGPCIDYEYHINMAVAQSAWHIYLSGAGDESYLENVVFPLVNDAATFFAEYLVKYNETLGKYTTHNLTDPDEYANHVDNGAYTNAGVSAVMRWALLIYSHLGREAPALFSKIAGNMYLATADSEDQITLEFSGMDSSVAVKQADVIMMTYPLENELLTVEQAYKNMEYYSLKQVSYGPAMTFPIFSIVASKLAKLGCASQSYLTKSVFPFLRGPFAQFSEQNDDNFVINGGTHPAFPFLTGHGGFIQAILQGITGLRYEHAVEDGKLIRILRVDPTAIPCLGGDFTLEGIKYHNHSLTLSIKDDTCTISNDGPVEASAPEFIRIKIGDRNSKKGSYVLRKDSKLVFDVYHTENAYKTSLSECQLASFTNITEGVLGDNTISINDGDNTTRWQAGSNLSTAKILVDLLEYKNVSTIFANWGDKPPKSWKISSFKNNFELKSTIDFLSHVDFGNELYKRYEFNNPEQIIYSQDEVFNTIVLEEVSISAPFNKEENSLVQVPRRHNTTEFIFAETELTRFLLVEATGIHDVEPTDNFLMGGAKFYELVVS